MRVLLRDRQTGLFVGTATKEGRLPPRVLTRDKARDYQHARIAVEESAALPGRDRLDVLLDFGDPVYDLAFSVPCVGQYLGRPDGRAKF